MLIRVAVCATMAAARLGELAYSRRNVKRRGGVEGKGSRDTYPLIVLVHTAAIAGTMLWGRRRPVWGWLLLLTAAQPGRLWTLLTLGERWNSHGVVAPDLRVETGGPYRYLRHPNYVVVIVELAALPLAFGLWRLALLLGLANAVLLAIRIRDEEAALLRLPGYREHFERKARLLPFVF